MAPEATLTNDYDVSVKLGRVPGPETQFVCLVLVALANWMASFGAYGDPNEFEKVYLSRDKTRDK